MAQLVSWHLTDGIAPITMDHGRADALSLAMVSALREARDRAQVDRAGAERQGAPLALRGQLRQN